MCSDVCGTLHYKDPLELLDKSRKKNILKQIEIGSKKMECIFTNRYSVWWLTSICWTGQFNSGHCNFVYGKKYCVIIKHSQVYLIMKNCHFNLTDFLLKFRNKKIEIVNILKHNNITSKLNNRMSNANKIIYVYRHITYYGGYTDKSRPFWFNDCLSALRCIHRPMLVPLSPLID